MSRAGSVVGGTSSTPTTNDIAIKALAEEMENAKNFSAEAAEKIQELTNQLKRLQSKPIKLSPLEKFDGTRSKLKGFLAAASIHLDVNQDKLPNDTARVSFVAAHFTGKAMDWFEIFLIERMKYPEEQWGPETRAIFTSYEYFEQKLTISFGEVDIKRVAEQKLQRLHQTKSASIYTSEFEQLASKLNWGEEALMARYYEGLKEHIRYELIRMDQPLTFAALAQQAIRIDDRLYFWNKSKKGGQFATNTVHRKSQDRGDPMKLGANQERYPKNKKKEELRKKGLCFLCELPGHLARDCEKNPKRGHDRQKLAANKESKKQENP